MRPPHTIIPIGYFETGNQTTSRNSQEGNTRVITFKQVLHQTWNYICCDNSYDGNITSTSLPSSLFRLWFAQNVYPLLTLKRILFFILSQLFFILAYGFFCQTKLYTSDISGGGGGRGDDDENHSHILARPLIFLGAAFGVHTMFLIFLFFFGFCSVALEKYRFHHLFKSLGEWAVKVLVVVLIMQFGEDGPTIKGFVTWCLLTIDSLFIIGLSNYAHHHSLFEAFVTITLHLGLAKERSLRISTIIFVFVVIGIKNFMSRHSDKSQNLPTPTRTPGLPLDGIATEV